MPTVPDNSAKPDKSAFRPLIAALIVIAAMTLLRVTYASLTELRTDEAYYWTWSKERALCFLDHPPMIAWFIRFGTAIFGDTNFGVRFAGILAMLVTQLLLADIVRMTVTIAVIIGVGYLVGFRFSAGVGDAIGMFALAIALGAAVCLISATVGLVLKN